MVNVHFYFFLYAAFLFLNSSYSCQRYIYLPREEEQRRFSSLTLIKLHHPQVKNAPQSVQEAYEAFEFAQEEEKELYKGLSTQAANHFSKDLSDLVTTYSLKQENLRNSLNDLTTTYNFITQKETGNALNFDELKKYTNHLKELLSRCKKILENCTERHNAWFAKVRSTRDRIKEDHGLPFCEITQNLEALHNLQVAHLHVISELVYDHENIKKHLDDMNSLFRVLNTIEEGRKEGYKVGYRNGFGQGENNLLDMALEESEKNTIKPENKVERRVDSTEALKNNIENNDEKTLESSQDFSFSLLFTNRTISLSVLVAGVTGFILLRWFRTT